MQKSLGLHLKGAAAALGAVKALAAPMQAVKKQHCPCRLMQLLPPKIGETLHFTADVLPGFPAEL